MGDIKFIHVGGFGSSGGTILKDFLREFNNLSIFEPEFRLVKDPYGLLDLESQIVLNWRNFLNSDIAIKDFLWMVRQFSQGGRFFRRIGSMYNKSLKTDINKAALKYVKTLSKKEFEISWHYYIFKMSRYEQLIYRMKRRLKFSHFKNLFYTRPNQVEFIKKTKSFINEIFMDFSQKNPIVLHNAMDIHEFERSLNYFDDIKAVLMDRDPRDTFYDVIENEKVSYLGQNFIKFKDVNLFIEDFKNRRSKIKSLLNDDRIFVVSVERFIEDYENISAKIINFLDLDSHAHINRKKYFNPNISKNNVGLWKNNTSYMKSIQLIETSLKEFLKY